MITSRRLRLLGATMLLALSGLLSSCEPPQVYGSVGYSSYSGGYGGYGGYGGGYRTSIGVGGRIY